MAVECWNEDGKRHCASLLAELSGAVVSGEAVMDREGELVCVKPFPSQPTHFWNDEDGIKYTKAYFSLFRGIV